MSSHTFTVFRANRVQTRRGGGGGVALYIKSSLKPVRPQSDIEASPCIEMIYCRIIIFSFPNRSNRTCPKSDGFDKNLLTSAVEEFLYQPITQSNRFRMGNRPSMLHLVLTRFPDTVPAIKLPAPLGNSDHALLYFTFGLHDSHESTRPRAKLCYND